MDFESQPLDFNQADFLEEIVQNLQIRGWSDLSRYFSPSTYLALHREALRLYHTNEFRRAAIGPIDEEQLRKDIRRDFIHWLNPSNLTAVQVQLSNSVNELMTFLSRRLYLSLKSFEAHFAVYPEGGFYKKHIDQFQTDCLRQLSFVIYLNPEWKPGDGGQLRIYNERNSEIIDTEIAPRLGNAVLFLSSSIYHEVLSTNQRRISIAGWMRKEVIAP